MTILRFPETPRTEDRPSGPEESARGSEASAGERPPSMDAGLLQSLTILNRPVLAAVMSRRPQAQDVLAAFQAEWTPPRLRTPRPANDAPRT